MKVREDVLEGDREVEVGNDGGCSRETAAAAEEVRGDEEAVPRGVDVEQEGWGVEFEGDAEVDSTPNVLVRSVSAMLMEELVMTYRHTFLCILYSLCVNPRTPPRNPTILYSPAICVLAATALPASCSSMINDDTANSIVSDAAEGILSLSRCCSRSNTMPRRWCVSCPDLGMENFSPA